MALRPLPCSGGRRRRSVRTLIRTSTDDARTTPSPPLKRVPVRKWKHLFYNQTRSPPPPKTQLPLHYATFTFFPRTWYNLINSLKSTQATIELNYIHRLLDIKSVPRTCLLLPILLYLNSSLKAINSDVYMATAITFSFDCAGEIFNHQTGVKIQYRSMKLTM